MTSVTHHVLYVLANEDGTAPKAITDALGEAGLNIAPVEVVSGNKSIHGDIAEEAPSIVVEE
jgi:hypothetical protein